ncbi:hypothetical protein [Agromyces sp. Leaf222]|uniref:hypothetical protein n=1 Tax=Agromyces sp. Leaf222 TaxID=1735688 RepID=UPI0006F2F996|nr:hypothetical protein [Agromyces sp. Leaf222]KQM82249.1 hypothetical protein ASE68_02210 [Agromyces sp. Leaf222]
MSNEAARGIDPRFDPRFQRGYKTDAAAAARAAERRRPDAPPTAEEAALFGPRPPGAPPERPTPRIEAAAPFAPTRVSEPDHAATLLAYFGPKAGAEATTSYAAEAQSQGRIEPSPLEQALHADDGMGAHDDFVVEPEPLSESPFVRHPSLSFWVALAASAAFVIAGVVLTWNVNLEQMRPTGRMAGAESQAFLSALSALAIGLVQAGALGVVVVLAMWAVQSRRRRTS